MTNETVSVLVPVRPHSRFVDALSQQFLSQDYQLLKLVAVLDRDDGSNEAKLRRLIPSEKLKIVRVNEAGGDVGRLLSLGLEASETDLVARMDDDDRYSRDRISKQVDEISSSPSVVLVATACDVVDTSDQLLYTIVPPENDCDFKFALLASNPVVHSSVLFRKSAVNRVGGYRSKMTGCEDYDLWLRLLSAGEFRGLRATCVQYLSHDSGASRRRITTHSLAKLYRARLQAARKMGVLNLSRNGGFVKWLFHFRPEWIVPVTRFSAIAGSAARRLRLR